MCMLVKVFKYILVSYLFGVFLHSYFSPDTILYTYSFIFFIIAGGLAVLSRKLLIYSLICLGVGLGVVHYSSSINLESKTVFDVFADQAEVTTLEGKIV